MKENILNNINFLNIVTLLYIDLRHVDIFNENLKELFIDDISKLNEKYQERFKIEITNNNFYIDILNANFYGFDLFLYILKVGFNESKDKQNELFFILNNFDIKESNDLYLLILLLSECTYGDKGGDFEKNIENFKDKSFLIYNLLQSVLQAFRLNRNLLVSCKYMTRLINRYFLSSFYLFRVRNIFLYFYQTVIGREKFYLYLKHDKEKIFGSKYMKLIFSDILIAKKINSYNDVIYLFEGAIYLHLLDSKGLKILRRLESNLYEDIHYWISDYYINIGNLNFALNELNKKKLTKNFKYYRKLLAIYINQNNLIGLLELYNELLKNNYTLGFYVKGKYIPNVIIYSFDECIENNDNLNIILDIEYDAFISIINNSIDNNYINLFFTYFRKNHMDYFLKNDSISIILKKT